MGNGRTKQLKKIAADALSDVVNKRINERCQAIEDYVRDYLQRTEKREKAIRGWLMQEVKFKMQNDLFNATCTVDAVVEILAKAGLNIPDFAAKVDAKKLEIRDRKIREADEAMRKEMEERAKASQEASAQATEQAEAVNPEAPSTEQSG